MDVDTNKPLLFRIAGPSNSGKTTWLLKLVTHLTEQGIKVATIKHSHHRLDVVSGKDGHQLGNLAPNITVGQDRLMLDEPLNEAPNLFALVARFYQGMEVVLVEGWRSENIPTLLIADPPDDWTVPEGIIARTIEVGSERFADVPIWKQEDVLDWIVFRMG